jgi:hypothetical protein
MKLKNVTSIENNKQVKSDYYASKHGNTIVYYKKIKLKSYDQRIKDSILIENTSTEEV